MKITQDIILQYLKKIKPELQNDGIDQIALFGSFAKDEQTVYSDIDIAIKKKSDFLQQNTAYDYFNMISNIKQKIQKVLHRNVDVFDLESDSELLESIKKEIIYV